MKQQGVMHNFYRLREFRGDGKAQKQHQNTLLVPAIPRERKNTDCGLWQTFSELSLVLTQCMQEDN